MKTIHTRSRSGPDGMLDLKIPVGVAGSEVEVVVIVQPLAGGGSNKPPRTAADRAAWERRVEELAGSIDDPAFTRHDQGDFEQRAPLG
jgi:hypothetical protein